MFNTYEQLIDFAKRQQRIKDKAHYFEEHHILPKSMGGDDSRDNLILLTLSEHVEAHYLLALEYEKTNKQYYVGNIQAAWMISHGKSKFSPRKRQEVELWLQDKNAQKLTEELKERLNSERPHRRGISLHYKDRIWAQKATQKPVRILERNLGTGSWVGYIKIVDCPICHKPNNETSFACCEDHAKKYIEKRKAEYKAERSQQVKDRWKNPEYAKRIIEANKGITHGHTGNWITNGSENIMVSDNDLANYLSAGWIRGRSNIKGAIQTKESKQKISERRKNSCYVYNDEVDCKEIPKGLLDEYLANGWKRGKRVHYSRKGIKQPPMAWVHNDSEFKRIRKEDLQEYLNNGWKRGRK